MSLQEQNRMLYILHNKGISRKNIQFIMKDLINSGIFEEPEYNDDFDDDWGFVEAEADWLFSNSFNSEKILALKYIKKRKDDFENTKVSSMYTASQEKRIQEKRKELIKKGVIRSDVSDISNLAKVTTRYGRSPLHEAIAMNDLRLVKKYIK